MIPHVMSDFLAWLWFLAEQGGYHELPDGSTVEVIVEEQISFREPNDPKEKSAFKGKISNDARKSFSMGRVIEAMTLVLRDPDEDRTYEVRFGTGGLSSFKVGLPMTSKESVETGVHENLLLLADVERYLERLLGDFLDRRVNRSEELLAQLSSLCVEPKPTDAAA